MTTTVIDIETAQDANVRLHEEAKRFIPGGVGSAIRIADPPLCIRKAQGAYLWDENGKRYIDYHAAFAPIILGHCHPAVVDRVIDTIRSSDLYGVTTTSLEVELAKRIVEHVPSVEQVLLCCTGSEATFHAVRLSRAATGRRKVIKFQGCYHGWFDYVLRNVISSPQLVNKWDPGSAGMLREAVEHTLVCRFNDLDSVEQAIRENAGDVAGIILEPIPHNVGCILPKQAFLQGLRAICDREGIVLIFDEVITGFRHNIGGYPGDLRRDPRPHGDGQGHCKWVPYRGDRRQTRADAALQHAGRRRRLLLGYVQRSLELRRGGTRYDRLPRNW